MKKSSLIKIWIDWGRVLHDINLKNNGAIVIKFARVLMTYVKHLPTPLPLYPFGPTSLLSTLVCLVLKYFWKLFFRTWTLPASSCTVGITQQSWWIFWVPLLLTHVTTRTAFQFLKNFKGLAVPTVVEFQSWEKHFFQKTFYLSEIFEFVHTMWECKGEGWSLSRT